MADKENEKKQEATLEDLQKQIGDINKQVTSLTDENKNLKEQLAQKELEITKLSLGGVEKQVTKVKEKEDEDVNFDFDF